MTDWPYRADYVKNDPTPEATNPDLPDATNTGTLGATSTRSQSVPPKTAQASAGSSSNLPDKKSAEDDEALPEGLFGRWLKRGGQENWRIMAVHVDRKHAYLRQEECRFTCGDLTTLGL